MADKETGKSRIRASVTPEEFTTAAPVQVSSGDYSYTVELVGRIEHQLGKLTEAIESLKAQTREHGSDLKAIGKDVHGTKVAVRVAAWMIGIFLTVLTLGWTIGWAIMSRPVPPVPH
jgi:hypothetical protein